MGPGSVNENNNLKVLKAAERYTEAKLNYKMMQQQVDAEEMEGQ